MHDAYKEGNYLSNKIEQKRVQFKSCSNSHILADAEKIDDMCLLFLTGVHDGFIEAHPEDAIDSASTFQSTLTPDHTTGSLIFNSRALLHPPTYSYQLRESGNRISPRIICGQSFLVSLA
jgi:hypothetical protein